MDLSTPFELPADSPIIPDKLLRDVERYRSMGLHRVTVTLASGGGWGKVNGFKLDDPKPGGEPSNSTDEVAELIVSCAEHHYEKTGRSGTYRAEFALKDKQKRSDRKFSSFPIPVDSQGGSRSNVVDDAHEYIELLKAVLEQQRTLNAQLIDYNQNLSDRLLDQSRIEGGRSEPLLRVIAELVKHYEVGLRMQGESLKAVLEAKYNTRTAEIEAESDQKMWETLSPAIKVASKQMLDHFGIEGDWDDEDDEDDDEDDEDDEEENAHSDEGEDDEDDEDDEDNDEKAASTKSHADDDDDDDEGDTDEKPKKKKRKKKTRSKKKGKSKQRKGPPVVRATQALLEGLTQDQWFELEQKLTTAQWKLLRKGSRADHEDAAASAIAKLKESLLSDLPRAAKVKKILRKAQFDALQAVTVLADRHLKEQKAKAKKKAKKKAKRKTGQSSEPPAADAGDDDSPEDEEGTDEASTSDS